tara:strand:- start:667 stop:1209 length:543 start_codon:yes stop_codon:yes gene_type:complete
MSIKIKIEPQSQEVKPSSVQISLEMRKTLDGKLMIMDHMHLDIVIDTKTSKITTFPKKELSEEIYGFQRNYLEYLRKEGVIVEDSIRSGNVFGSLEATYPVSAEPSINATQVVLLSTKKFLDKQTPAFEAQEYIENEIDDHLIDPTPEDSTELGEVPEEPKKGSITPYRIRRYLSGYGYY